MRFLVSSAAFCIFLSQAFCGDTTGSTWRSLPLITGGKIDPAWVHIGWGGFAIDDGTLRTDCDEKGMGLLVYQKEKFGNCQIRVIYKVKDPKSNAGVYVRIDDAILAKRNEKPSPAQRTKDGKLTKEMLKKFQDASEKEQGPWYAVHHGYEVQICDDAGEWNRTGSIYSLAKATFRMKPSTEWRTMIITLQGEKVLVDIDGKRISTFDATGPDVPTNRKWHEPRREPVRPQSGYIGLQNHDPGDVAWFKEVSVRRLEPIK